MPDTNFIVQHERTDFCTLVANSALPSFTSDMTSEKETSACVIIPNRLVSGAAVQNSDQKVFCKTA